jgi:hypothetical protein
MIKTSNHLTPRDKQALAVFFGITLMSSLYFASGILVTYVSSPGAIEKGFTVRVLGLQNHAMAEQLSAALQSQRQLPAVIETAPTGQGYLLKVGPLKRLSDAESLANDLHNSGYGIVRIVENCGPGISDCNQDQQNPISGQRR